MPAQSLGRNSINPFSSLPALPSEYPPSFHTIAARLPWGPSPQSTHIRIVRRHCAVCSMNQRKVHVFSNNGFSLGTWSLAAQLLNCCHGADNNLTHSVIQARTLISRDYPASRLPERSGRISCAIE